MFKDVWYGAVSSNVISGEIFCFWCTTDAIWPVISTVINLHSLDASSESDCLSFKAAFWPESYFSLQPPHVLNAHAGAGEQYHTLSASRFCPWISTASKHINTWINEQQISRCKVSNLIIITEIQWVKKSGDIGTSINTRWWHGQNMRAQEVRSYVTWLGDWSHTMSSVVQNQRSNST